LTIGNRANEIDKIKKIPEVKMSKMSQKTFDKLKNAQKFQGILKQAKDRDINESDTVQIIKDMLGDVFGFDKYSELTSEFMIRGTFCDIAIKVENKIQYIIEAKAVGIELNKRHLQQTLSYGAQQGVQWIVLTNGLVWQIYRIKFEQPIDCELMCSINLSEINLKNEQCLDKLYLLTREGVLKSAREEYYEKILCVNKHVFGALLINEPVILCVKKELKRLYPNIKINAEEILHIMVTDVIKRELVEDEEAIKIQDKIKKMYKKIFIAAEKSKLNNFEPSLDVSTEPEASEDTTQVAVESDSQDI
jgi:predicted type IV restriction endonuclease